VKDGGEKKKRAPVKKKRPDNIEDFQYRGERGGGGKGRVLLRYFYKKLLAANREERLIRRMGIAENGPCVNANSEPSFGSRKKKQGWVISRGEGNERKEEDA